MKTIEELITQLKLNPEQSQIVKKYFEDLVIELLESLKQDNLQNFEETISSIRQS
jgi:restriction endonuclease Mrr